MAYIALKPCKFAGQKFKIGESVPAECIHAGAAKNLVKMQIISPADSEGAPVKSAGAPKSTVTVNVKSNGENMPLELTLEGLQKVVDALTSNAKDAEKVVGKMTDGDALILLHMSDGRTSIKAAAEARAKKLSGTEDSAGEE